MATCHSRGSYLVGTYLVLISLHSLDKSTVGYRIQNPSLLRTVVYRVHTVIRWDRRTRSTTMWLMGVAQPETKERWSRTTQRASKGPELRVTH